MKAKTPNRTPEYLFRPRVLKRVLDRLRLRRISLLLDFDGTITPIRRRPELAVLSDSTRRLLASLAAAPKVSVCIVTGRSLRDIRARAKVKGVSYVGNHGLEIWHDNRLWVHPGVDGKKRELKAISRKLKAAAKRMGAPGVLVEDKGLSLSVHYRGVDKKFLGPIEALVRASAGTFSIHEGKKIFELRPLPDWDKGRAAVKWAELAGLKKACRVCAGDDKTDEDVFQAMNGTDVAVSVGRKKKTMAGFWVKDRREVLRFLDALSSIRKTGASGEAERQKRG